MAIARPRLATQISGTLGPVEFAQHKSLVIIRKRKKPKTLVTWRTIESQRLNQLKLTTWKSLLPYTTLIDQWNLWAATHPLTNRLGQPYTLSPFQHFMRLYMPTPSNLYNYTVYTPTEYPQTPPPDPFLAHLIAPSTLIVTADFSATDTKPITRSFFYSDPYTTADPPQNLRHHHLAYNGYNYPQSATVNFTALLTARHITFTPGSKTIITVTGARGRQPRSTPSIHTLTVAAP